MSDITNHIAAGENEIVVKVSHRAPNSRWYSGAGIFRNVYLIEHDGAFIKSDSVYFSAKPDGACWSVKLFCEAEGNPDGLSVSYSVKDG